MSSNAVEIFKVESRYFNKIEFHNNIVIKSSQNIEKLMSEIKFYENLPICLKAYFPKYLGNSDKGFYQYGYILERIYEQDLGVQIATDPQNKKLLSALNLIQNFFSLVDKKVVSKQKFLENLELSLFQKNHDRLREIEKHHMFTTLNDICEANMNISLNEFAKLLEFNLRHEFENENTLWFSHGDLCFSNIFVKDNSLILIDPKGFEQPGLFSYLTPYYDLAKLSQCINGSYDFYNQGLESNPTNATLKERLEALVLDSGCKMKLVRLVESSHFISMIPLHIDCEKKMRLFMLQAITSLKESQCL